MMVCRSHRQLISSVQNHFSFTEREVWSLSEWFSRSILSCDMDDRHEFFQLFTMSSVRSLVRTSWKVVVMGNLLSLHSYITAYHKKESNHLVGHGSKRTCLHCSHSHTSFYSFVFICGESIGHSPNIQVAGLCIVSRLLLFKQVFGIIYALIHLIHLEWTRRYI